MQSSLSTQSMISVRWTVFFCCFCGVVLFFACSPAFPPASLITSPRVIAIISDHSEVEPGQSIQLTPIVVGPQGPIKNSFLTSQWWQCSADEGTALADENVCRNWDARTINSQDFTYTDTVSENFFGINWRAATEGELIPSGAVPSDKLLGSILGYWHINGVDLTYAPGTEDENLQRAIKRTTVYAPIRLDSIDGRLKDIDVRVHDDNELHYNQNPEWLSLSIHEESVDGPEVQNIEKGKKYVFVPHINTASMEDYYALRIDTQALPLDDQAALAKLTIDDFLQHTEKFRRCEIPLINWYVTGGKLRQDVSVDETVVKEVFAPRGISCPTIEGDPRVSSVEYIAPDGETETPEPPNGTLHIYAVLRDGRGGEAFISREVPYTP